MSCLSFGMFTEEGNNLLHAALIELLDEKFELRTFGREACESLKAKLFKIEEKHPEVFDSCVRGSIFTFLKGNIGSRISQTLLNLFIGVNMKFLLVIHVSHLIFDKEKKQPDEVILKSFDSRDDALVYFQEISNSPNVYVKNIFFVSREYNIKIDNLDYTSFEGEYKNEPTK
jgi:hypothetical protein